VHNFHLTLRVYEFRAWHIQRTYQFLTSYGYPFLSYMYVWLDLIVLPSLGTVTAHAPCHVTYHRGRGRCKNYPHFWNPWPQFTYSLCHFPGATTKMKPCYMRKIAFITLCRLESSLRMRSITWPVHRGPPNPHITIFDPELYIRYTTFMGLWWRLRVVYIGASHMLKRRSAAKKLSSQNRSAKWWCFGNLRV